MVMQAQDLIKIVNIAGRFQQLARDYSLRPELDCTVDQLVIKLIQVQEKLDLDSLDQADELKLVTEIHLMRL